MNNLTLKELEILAQAYLDCRLSRVQEKELELVLYNTDMSSPVIDEARLTMGISTLMEAGRKPRTLHLKQRRRWFGAAAWAAASVGVLVIASLLYFSGSSFPSGNSDGEYVSVYVDGKPLSREDALAEAAMSQAASMAMMERMLAEAKADSERNMEYFK